MKGGRFHWTEGLKSITAGKAEIGLGTACRALERYFVEQGVTDQVTPRKVSQRLRDIGFRKQGFTGFGYDREPLYRRGAGGHA